MRLLACLLAGVLGCPWLLVQCVGWVGMFAKYAEDTRSVRIALEYTFDGKHACQVCEWVSENQQDQREESPVLQEEIKWSGLPFQNTVPLEHPLLGAWPPCLGTSSRPCFIPPESPPPEEFFLPSILSPDGLV